MTKPRPQDERELGRLRMALTRRLVRQLVTEGTVTGGGHTYTVTHTGHLDEPVVLTRADGRVVELWVGIGLEPVTQPVAAVRAAGRGKSVRAA